MIEGLYPYLHMFVVFVLVFPCLFSAPLPFMFELKRSGGAISSMKLLFSEDPSLIRNIFE